mmetsp:Transcript_27701/g.61817  ORF Transcript_27701/g.61817 Transcript_27701/m.61817 type:complete len:421 (-) Transcript_27701:297-1559(-)
MAMTPETTDDPIAPEWPSYCNPRYVMPASIQVMITGSDGRTVRMPVAVTKMLPGSKPYLGGYRHKKTGYLYHHASTQTVEGLPRKGGWKKPENQSHRDTQTYEYKTRTIMTGRECGTQMERKDLLLDNVGDTVVVSKVYFSASQLDEVKRQKTLVIQCYWRGYVARHKTWKIREALYNQYLETQRAQAEAAAEVEKKKQYEINRRTNPKSAADFELLYHELDEWTQKEKQAAQALSSDKERKARNAEILTKQTKALHTIDKLKAAASKNGRGKRVDKMLELMGKPKLVEMTSGEVQEVHTQFTVRAAELMDLYSGLGDLAVSIDDRLDILLNVKWTVREFDCKLSREITDLCDREAEMLNRGRGEETLAGLRKRLSNLFLQFIETPDFNPEATRFLKVPPKPPSGSSSGTSLRKLMSQTA